MMQHVTKKGEHKLVQHCDYPLTATRVVSLVITDLGVFEPTGDGFRVDRARSGRDPGAGRGRHRRSPPLRGDGVHLVNLAPVTRRVS